MYVYRILLKSGVYLFLANYSSPEFMKQRVLYIFYYNFRPTQVFIPPPWKLGVYSKPAFSFEKIRYSRFYLNSHTAKYIERSLSGEIFDSRQSALKPQKQKKTSERLLPFVIPYKRAKSLKYMLVRAKL